MKILDIILDSKDPEPSLEDYISFSRMETKPSLSLPICYHSTEFPAFYPFLLGNMVYTLPEDPYYRHLAHTNELLRLLPVHNRPLLLQEPFWSIWLVLETSKAA